MAREGGLAARVEAGLRELEKPWPHRRPQHGGPDDLPMTPPAASSVTGTRLRASATQRILARQRPVTVSQGRESTGLEVSTGCWWHVEPEPRGLVAFAVMHRPAYPVAESELSGHRNAQRYMDLSEGKLV